MGIGGAHHHFICRQRLYSRPKPHLGADDADGGGLNVQDSWTSGKPGKGKGGVFVPRDSSRGSRERWIISKGWRGRGKHSESGRELR